MSNAEAGERVFCRGAPYTRRRTIALVSTQATDSVRLVAGIAGIAGVAGVAARWYGGTGEAERAALVRRARMYREQPNNRGQGEGLGEQHATHQDVHSDEDGDETVALLVVARARLAPLASDTDATVQDVGLVRGPNIHAHDQRGRIEHGMGDAMALVLAPVQRNSNQHDDDAEPQEPQMAPLLNSPTPAAVDHGGDDDDDKMALVWVPRAQLVRLNEAGGGIDEEMTLVLVPQAPSEVGSDTDINNDGSLNETTALVVVPRVQHERSNHRNHRNHNSHNNHRNHNSHNNHNNHNNHNEHGNQAEQIQEGEAAALVPAARVQPGRDIEADPPASADSGKHLGKHRCIWPAAPCVVAVQPSHRLYLAVLVLLTVSNLMLLAQLCAPKAGPSGPSGPLGLSLTLDPAAYASASLRTLCGVEVELFLALGATWTDTDVELVYCRLLQRIA